MPDASAMPAVCDVFVAGGGPAGSTIGALKREIEFVSSYHAKRRAYKEAA